MNDKHHTENFEKYLRDQAGEHRMYPSDYVWRNIRKKMHAPKKWPALSVFAVLIISSIVVGTVLNKPVPDTVTANFRFTLQSPEININQKKEENTNSIAQSNLTDEHYSVEQITSNTITAAVEKIKIDNAVEKQLLAVEQNNSPEYNQAFSNVPAIANSKVSTIQKNPEIVIASSKPGNSFASLKNINNYFFDVTSRLKSILNSKPVSNRSGGFAFFLSKSNNISYSNDFDFRVQPKHTDLFPQALEQLSKNSSRFDFRFYITPSVSYRHLNEQKGKTGQPNTVALESNYQVNPSQAIHQSPAIGYETGFGLGYQISNKFTALGGFQFNISQYKIDAYLYKTEPVALTLDEGKFSSTINTESSLRSIPGSKPLTIKNRYYQISMPFGLEWMAWNNDKLSWGLVGSLAPTYTFDKQPLIISSNYKNYADGSAYVRNWNVNASLGSYLGYTMGSYRWQIGPQIRYQILPSLVDKYPNHEYLINYGLNIGVVKTLK